MFKEQINVGAIDCKNEGKELCSLYDIHQYPSLKYISLEEDHSGKVYTFSDTRNMQMLEKFSLLDGYKQANWKEIPHEVGIEDRLSILTGKAVSADSVRPDKIEETAETTFT